MAKLRYREGALHAKGGLGEATSSAVDVATRELVSLTENHGPDTVEEGDIDELLKWTNGLNYDQLVYPYSTASCTCNVMWYCGINVNPGMLQSGKVQLPVQCLVVSAVAWNRSTFDSHSVNR